MQRVFANVQILQMIPARNYRHACESGHPELAPGLNRGGSALRLRPWTPASAGATEKEELETIFWVHATRNVYAVPGGILQPELDFAADSLQIVKSRFFDAIFACGATAPGGRRRGAMLSPI